MGDEMYDINNYTNEEMYDILNLIRPTDNELEARIIQMIQKHMYSTDPTGKKLFDFFKEMYEHFFDSGEESLITQAPSQAQTIATSQSPLQTSVQTISTSKPESTKRNDEEVQYVNEISHTAGKVNPILRESYQRIITVDSKNRDIEYPSSTSFTMNFTETLKDVVRLKLYAIELPITWYTITNSYGSNFFFLKPQNKTERNNNTFAIYQKSNHEYKVKVDPGNYKPLTLVSAINNRIQLLSSQYADVSFGSTILSYNEESAMSEFTFDIQKVYNEFYYEVHITSSLASMLGFDSEVNDTTAIYNLINSYEDISLSRYSFSEPNNTLQLIQYIPENEDDEYYDSLTGSNLSAIDTFTVTLPANQEKTLSEWASTITLILNTNDIFENSTVSIEELVAPDSTIINYYMVWRLKLNRLKIKNIEGSKWTLFRPNIATYNFFLESRSNELSRHRLVHDYESDFVLPSTEQHTIILKPIEDSAGGVYINPQEYPSYSDYNDIIFEIPSETYNVLNANVESSSNIVYVLNTMFSQNPLTSGTKITIDSDNNKKLKICYNVNKIYTTADYRIVFYDIFSFSSSSSTSNFYRNSTIDSTLGYILGFKGLPEYNFTESSMIAVTVVDETTTYYQNPEILLPSGNIYSFSSVRNGFGNETNKIFRLKGDSVLSVYLYNYFMILLDDFNQNHLNDGLVTVSPQDRRSKLPSYANRKSSRKYDPVTNKDVITVENVDGLTKNQVYSASQIVSIQNEPKSLFAPILASNDMFALIPVKSAGATPGSIYVEFGGTLQQQERTYFGPINLRRISVKLVNDKGDVVDLNGANWSFQLVCELLYQNNNAKK